MTKPLRIPDNDAWAIKEIASRLGSDLPIERVIGWLNCIYELGHQQRRLETLQNELIIEHLKEQSHG